jgi:hypothetical protein
LVVISGYPSELYDTCLGDWGTTTFTARTHRGIREEKLWFNFETPNWLHDGRHLGRNFRERQTIKRRRERLQKRIAALSLHEQRALFDALDDSRREKRAQLDALDITRGAQRLSDFLLHSVATEGCVPKSPVSLVNARPVQMSLFAALDLEAVTEAAPHPKKKGLQRAESAFGLGNQRKVG